MKAINKKAVNKVFLGQENKGKGRYFKSRFIEAGLVQYDFGLCLLSKTSLDKFVQGFVGCPVIIEHNEVYDDNAKELRVGAISRVWFDDADGYYWCEGIIWDERALDLIINKGWSVSCQYDITEVDEEGGIHNGVEFDKTILNGSPEHLALVDAPRYEAALIAVNSGKKKFLFNKAINSVFKEEEHPRDNDGKFTSGGNSTFYNEATKTIELQGNELGSTEDEIRENGLKYFKENYQGKKFDNPELKGVLFSRAGLNKLKSNSADIEKIKAIPALKDIIEKGKYQGSEDLAHPRQDGIIKFHRINHDVSINGQKENMSVLIGEDRDGNRFYNLNNRTYTAENSSRVIRAKGRADEEFSINIITDIQENFNPDIANYKAQNNKEIEEMGIVEDLEKLILKAKNKGDSMKSKNEDTDKRKLIDEVAGMMKSAGADDELIRTAIAKMEKLAYDKSEVGTADNKAKNEDEEDDKEEAKNKCRNEEDCGKKDEKADNKCRNKDEDEDVENEDEDEYDRLKREVDDEAKNKAKNKARNSISDFKKSFYDYDGGRYDTGYISQKKGIELGKQVF